MAEDDPRILKLESAVAALTQQLVAVQEQLAATRIDGFRSIRDSRRCPACGSGALLHVREAQEMGNNNGTLQFAVKQVRSFWGNITPRGTFELFVCRQCAIVEWRVIDVAEIPVDGKDIVAIEPEGEPPAAGPFR